MPVQRQPTEAHHKVNASIAETHIRIRLFYVRAVTFAQWLYSYGSCTTQLCTIRLRNMVELGMGRMWTRKIRAMSI